MARFLPYEDLVERDLLSRSDVQWLAGQISALPAFKQGAAVVCGSVSWGAHSWRSDIDIAHFRSVDYPIIDADIENVVSDFLDRSGRRFITPRIDIAVIGEQSQDLAERAERKRKKRVTDANLSIVGPPTSLELTEQTEPHIFADTAERFGDHIGCLARLKGQPWREFFQRYLSGERRPLPQQRESINAYVATVSGAWEQQPLHALSRGAGKVFTVRQLDLLAQAENYPVNLMRRILAAMDRYPAPDRIQDVRSSFAKVPDAWARKIIAALPPFVALSDQYEALVAACRQPDGRPTSDQFHERIELAATQLPFAAIQEAVWEYLET
jgi:hypothetical protein